MANLKTKDISADEILNILNKHQDTLKKYKVKKIGLFGSYVRSDQKKKSDIDLLIEFDRAAFDSNFTGYSDNFDNLSSFLKKILGRKIDLITDQMISPYIKPYVLKEVRYLERS